MPYSLVVSGLDMVNSLVAEIPDFFPVIFENLLPGKFTFLFKAAKRISPLLLKGNDKIGIRVPNTPHLLKLVQILDFPLISTSVNRSGTPPLNDPLAIIREFSVDLTTEDAAILLDAGKLPPSHGSTIVDITQSPPKVIRQGDDYEKWQQFSGKHFNNI